jgi:hypothetical protein
MLKIAHVWFVGTSWVLNLHKLGNAHKLYKPHVIKF